MDIEAGYSKTVEGVVKTVNAALNIGAVGINLEDSTGNDEKPFFEISEMVEKIKAIREMVNKKDFHLAINQRTDVYMLGKEGHKEKFKRTVERANIYREAGADCIFIPDMENFNKQMIMELVKEIDAPLNIIAGENIPTIQQLKDIGVARVSFGPRLMRAVYALLKKIMKEITNGGTYSNMVKDTLSYSEVNKLLSRSQ